MATEPAPQRAYRAACPNCGAPVEFRSAAAPFAVCSFCHSTVVRAGDQLRKIGESAEVFEDHSPLALGAAGRYAGTPFTLLGRLQYRYSDGTWNEWYALFDGGADGQRSGWLSEDNGRYVFAFDAPLTSPVPPAERLQPGAPLTVNGESWSAASVVAAKLIAAQGELPRRPNLEHGFVVADMRSSRGEVGTLDYTDAVHPTWSVGRSVALSELALTGLAETGEKTLGARGVTCPNCGAALEVKLETTQSIVCHQCKSVVDVSKGVGGDLAYFAQGNGMEPQIPLGTVGTLALGGTALPWQVVGYVERCEVAQAGDDEQSFWREYLLYHRATGFAFIVDAEDGWSWSVPVTGAPQAAGNGVRYDGVAYRKLYDYAGRITYVLGEFYWRLTKGEITYNSDYVGTGAASANRLNREQTKGEGTAEVVWSAGQTLAAETVAAAFRLAPDKRAALQRDALPTAFGRSSLLGKILFWGFIILLVLILMRCTFGGGGPSDCRQTRDTYGQASQEYQNCLNSRQSGSGYRTGGGAFGGFSSGGSHK